ncbi:MAG: radical SAM protein [Clostridium sp.]|nr:radical SAM protein [Clostridium sp.]
MKKFKRVYVEITNVCNLSCSFCPKTKRKYKFLDVDSYKKVLESLKPYTQYIYFHLMGEPLLNPNLEEFLNIAYEEGFKVNITTNGTLLPKVKYILINSKALRQVFSTNY